MFYAPRHHPKEFPLSKLAAKRASPSARILTTRARCTEGQPTRPKSAGKPVDPPVDPPPGRYVPAPPLSLADAASQLGVRPVQLAQAVREGKVATVRGRGADLLIAQDELERVRREGVEA